MDLSQYVIAVLGGDGRELECARQAQAQGAEVRICGLPQGDYSGIQVCQSVAEAVRGADIVICPVPLPQADGSLYAPQSETALMVDSQSLAEMVPGGVLVTGIASSQMKEAAKKLNLKLREYEQDEELMILRAPAIAEGAIRIAIEHTEVTLHENPCLIVGFGKIGPALAHSLLGLGARVTVAARNAVQRARAWEMGCTAVPLEQLLMAGQHATAVFNIASAPLLDRSFLERVDPKVVLIDLAAPPGGIDFEAAKDLGLTAIWGRGLGGRAPRTVGRVQWTGIIRILEEEL